MIWLGVLTVVFLLLVSDLIYFIFYLKWEITNTRGMAYYGKSLAERRALKKRIRQYSFPAMPIAYLLGAFVRRVKKKPAFQYEGISGPRRSTSLESFKRAKNYNPHPEDVIVATQMRCGTTWMQQIVYETVNRGQGDLSDKGHGHLYAVSPWLDGLNSVPMEEAPLVGESPTRIIKTHLPTKLCPYNEQAKYIYVARHPVSCFASIVDYNRTLLGPLSPTIENLMEQFCSDQMIWGPWPDHVAGWWQWNQNRQNVLFIYFEDMKADFAAVLDRVAGFLGYQLTDNERQRVAEKCSFKYMKDREELFEMAPPNMFTVAGGRFMASGKKLRFKDVPTAIREHILDYCRKSPSRKKYPDTGFYPELM
jgi:hypothetical protein